MDFICIKGTLRLEGRTLPVIEDIFCAVSHAFVQMKDSLH